MHAVVVDDNLARQGFLDNCNRRNVLLRNPALRFCEVLDQLRAVGVVLADLVVVERLFDEVTRPNSRVTAAVAASAQRNNASPSISATSCPSSSTRGLGRITCRSRIKPSRLTASIIRPRASTTSSGCTHQSDQEKTTRSNEPGAISSRSADATRNETLSANSSGSATRAFSTASASGSNATTWSLLGEACRQPPIAAAHLEHSRPAKIGKATKRCPMRALRIKGSGHSRSLQHPDAPRGDR